MKFSPKKIVYATSFGLAVSLTACTDSYQITEDLEAPDDPSPDVVTVSGTAAKGFLNAANVVISNALTNDVMATGTTDTSGLYNLIIPRADTAVVINVTPTPTTTMICDSVDGCSGGASFGQSISFNDDTFQLRTITTVPQSTGTDETVTANLNAITTAAASRISTLLASEADATFDIISQRVAQGNQEIAALVNNVLGTEGTDDAITTTDLSKLPNIDLTNPSTTGVEETLRRQATLTSMVNASFFQLANSSGTTVEQAVKNFASDSSDGAVNVNSTATNINSNETTNLAAIASAVRTVTTNIVNQVTTNIGSEAVTNLQTLLTPPGSTDTVDINTLTTQITDKVEEVVTKKTAVTDANNDDTAPIEVVDPTTPADGKALEIAVLFDNSIKAVNAAFTPVEGDDNQGALSDLVELFEVTAADEEDLIMTIGNAVILAAEMLNTSSETLTSLGCATGEGTITCETAEIGVWLDEALPISTATTGSFVLTTATNTVALSGLTWGGYTYALTLVGDGGDLDSVAAAMYTISSATVTNGSDATVLSVGSTSTFSGTLTSGVGETATVNLEDVALTFSDVYSFTGDIEYTQTYRNSSGEFNVPVVSHIDMNGSMTNNYQASSTTGSVATISLDQTVDTSGFDPANVPNGSGDETEQSFYKVTDFVLNVSVPVTYAKRTLSSDRTSTSVPSQASDYPTETLRVVAAFERLTLDTNIEYELDIVLSGGGKTRRLDGTLTHNNDVFTAAFTNGTPGVALNFTKTESVAAGEEYSGSVTVDSVEEISISGTGVVTTDVAGTGDESAVTFNLAFD